MTRPLDPSRDLLFGLLALQVGLIDQAQLVAAIRSWTGDKATPLADHLGAPGHLDARRRAAVEAMVALCLEAHGGAERGIARLGVDRATLEAFYIRGRSLKQMSREFETPVGTIKRRLHVARNRLRKQLESERELVCA